MAYNPDPRLVAAIRQYAGPRAPLALATALVESGGRLDAEGDQGRSHGPFQEYDFGRGAGIPVAGRRDPVASTRRFIRELETFSRRGFRGADLAYRTQRPADRSGYIRKINAALPVAKQILGGAVGGGAAAVGVGETGYLGAFGAPRASLPRGLGAFDQPPPVVLTQKLQRQLQQYLAGSREDVMAGRTPRDPLAIVAAISRQQQRAREATARADVGALELPTVPRTYNLRNGAMPGGGYTAATNPNIQLLLKKYPSGSVNSGKVVRGGEGGNWGGSLERALQVAQIAGITPSSQKRSRQRTASGGISDHWVGSTRSYAVDLPATGKIGDTAFVKILRGLGLNPARYPAGRWHNVNIGGYRYQIGWRTPGHFDHVHVGVARI